MEETDSPIPQWWRAQGDLSTRTRGVVDPRAAAEGEWWVIKAAQASTVQLLQAWGAGPFKAPKLGAGTLTTLSGTQPLLAQASDSTYCRHPYPGPLVHSSAPAVTSRSPQARTHALPSRSSNGARCPALRPLPAPSTGKREDSSPVRRAVPGAPARAARGEAHPTPRRLWASGDLPSTTRSPRRLRRSVAPLPLGRLSLRALPPASLPGHRAKGSLSSRTRSRPVV